MIGEEQTAVAASSRAEQRILAECDRGVLIDCTQLPDDDRVVSGVFLRALLLGLLESEVHPSGLQVTGLTVAGAFDVRFCEVAAPFRFRNCVFSDTPHIGLARLAGVEFQECSLPGLWANAARIDYLLSLDGSTIKGKVSLVRSEIGNIFTAQGTHINPSGRIALNATLSRIGASLHLGEGFESVGQVVLTAAQVAGDVDLDGATITCARTEDAITMDQAEIRGSVRGNVTTTGAIRLGHAKIGADLKLSGVIHGHGKSGLVFHEADVAGAVMLSGTVEGTVGGYGSAIGGMICSGASLVTPGATALDLSRATIRSNVEVEQTSSITGEVTLIGATIRGGVMLSDANLHNDRGFALVLDFSRIEGNIAISGKSKIHGGIRFVDADVSGGVLAQHCLIDGAEQEAVVGDRSRIGGNVHLADRVRLHGTTSLAAAAIGGSVMLRSASLSTDLGNALDLRFAQMRLGLRLQDSSVKGGVDLYGAHADGLEDDVGVGPDGMGSWSTIDPLVLEGFTYRSLAGSASYDRRLRERWLLHTSTYEPESWAQLEEVFRASGRADDARRIAMAGHRDRIQRGGLSWAGRAWRRLLGATIGHGYAPARAGIWGVAIIAIFTLLVWLNLDMFVPAKTDGIALAPHPQPFVYAADVFLPIIDFHEADAWRAIDWMQVVQWMVIAAGWAISTVFVAGYTRIVRD